MSAIQRREAINRAVERNAWNDLTPSQFALDVYEQWVDGYLDAEDAMALLLGHHQELERAALTSDHAAAQNKLGITDSGRLRQAEADITTLRMAQMEAS